MSAEPISQPCFSAEPVMRPRQQVERQLRRAILDGAFLRGDRLPSEVQLADQFQVSRSTIREALRALVEAGLVRKVPGARGGSFVEYFDHNGLADVVVERLINTLELGGLSYNEVAEFRNVLEVPSARLAARRRTADHLVALRAVVDAEKHTSASDPAVDGYNIRFHKLVAEASGNRLLAAFVTALHNVAHPLRFIDTSAEVGRLAVRHHIEIVSAIAASDPSGAEVAMLNHLAFLRTHAVATPPASSRR